MAADGREPSFNAQLLAAVEALEMVATPLDGVVAPPALIAAFGELVARRVAQIGQTELREVLFETWLAGVRRRIDQKVGQRAAAGAEAESQEARRATKH